jgi:hypothetical protein
LIHGAIARNCVVRRATEHIVKNTSDWRWSLHRSFHSLLAPFVFRIRQETEGGLKPTPPLYATRYCSPASISISSAPVLVTYEIPEFQRQNRDFAAAVKAAGKPVEAIADNYNRLETEGPR